MPWTRYKGHVWITGGVRHGSVRFRKRAEISSAEMVSAHKTGAIQFSSLKVARQKTLVLWDSNGVCARHWNVVFPDLIEKSRFSYYIGPFVFLKWCLKHKKSPFNSDRRDCSFWIIPYCLWSHRLLVSARSASREVELRRMLYLRLEKCR